MRNILVTGASGFVGTVLCRALSERSYAVRRTDAIIGPDENVVVGDLGPATVWKQAAAAGVWRPAPG